MAGFRPAVFFPLGGNMDADVTIRNEGTIFIFDLNTETARTWVDEHVQEGAQWWGAHGLVVEHGFAAYLTEGMVNDGLVVE